MAAAIYPSFRYKQADDLLMAGDEMPSLYPHWSTLRTFRSIVAAARVDQPHGKTPAIKTSSGYNPVPGAG
ncbi:hypothetical protein JW859_10660 [bacterium]|nr:hypothetical protein [bacterium]